MRRRIANRGAASPVFELLDSRRVRRDCTPSPTVLFIHVGVPEPVEWHPSHLEHDFNRRAIANDRGVTVQPHIYRRVDPENDVIQLSTRDCTEILILRKSSAVRRDELEVVRVELACA